jgi:mannosyltransferase
VKRSTALILAVILIGLGLRVWNLASQSIWWDEAFTWQMTSHGPDNLLQMLLTGDRNPPLYSVSAALWGGVAGWSEFSLRFLSVIWGVIGLGFLFNLTKRLFGTHAGIWALAVAAVSPALVVYSQEARMYSAFFALAAATLYFGIRFLDRGNQKSAWSFLLCEAALLLTHYFAIPVVATLNLFAFVILFRRHVKFSAYARWIGGQVLAALPVLIWTMIVFTTPGSLIAAKEAPPDVLAFLYQVLTLWLTGVRALDLAYLDLMLPAIGLIVIASIGAWLGNGRRALSVIMFSIVALVIAFALTSVLTSFHPRYVLPYGIPLFALIGASASSITSRRIWPTAICGLVIVVTIGLTLASWQVANDPKYAKDDARGVAAYLKQNTAADDVILIEANDYTLNYYAHGPASIEMITASTEDEAFRQMSDAIGATKRVWLAHWHISTQDPRDYWRFLLEQSGSMQDWTSYHGYELYRYEMQSPLHEPAVDKDGLPAQGSAYFDKWSGIDGQGADGALTFAIRWQIERNIYRRGEVSVRLKDEAGTPISVIDIPLLNEQGSPVALTDSTQSTLNYYVLPIPPGTPPLTYTLSAFVYVAEGEQQTDQEFNIFPVEKTLDMIRLPRRMDSSDPYRTLLGYQWQMPSSHEVASGLELEAFAIGDKSPSPQQPTDVTLRWRKTGPTVHVEPKLRLVQNGRIRVEIGSNLLERDYPIGQWVDGETVIDRLKFTFPPMLGEMQLQIGQGDQWITLTPLSLDTSSLKFQLPSIQHTQSAIFDNVAELLGYDLKSDSIAPDRSLDLALYWRALNTEPITTSYTIFTQLIAPDGHLVAQHDAPPIPPTMAWVPGEIINDHHALTIVDPTYHGPATLIVGWYNSATVVRVPVKGGGDFVTLATPIRVEDK